MPPVTTKKMQTRHEDKQRTPQGNKGAESMATSVVDTKVPEQFKMASKSVREFIEQLLDPFEGKKLKDAQAAVSEVHRTGRPATTEEWQARYREAVEIAVA